MSSYTIRLRKYISPYADVSSWLVAAGALVKVEDGAAIIMIPNCCLLWEIVFAGGRLLCGGVV